MRLIEPFNQIILKEADYVLKLTDLKDEQQNVTSEFGRHVDRSYWIMAIETFNPNLYSSDVSKAMENHTDQGKVKEKKE